MAHIYYKQRNSKSTSADALVVNKPDRNITFSPVNDANTESDTSQFSILDDAYIKHFLEFLSSLGDKLHLSPINFALCLIIAFLVISLFFLVRKKFFLIQVRNVTISSQTLSSTNTESANPGLENIQDNQTQVPDIQPTYGGTGDQGGNNKDPMPEKPHIIMKLGLLQTLKDIAQRKPDARKNNKPLFKTLESEKRRIERKLATYSGISQDLPGLQDIKDSKLYQEKKDELQSKMADLFPRDVCKQILESMSKSETDPVKLRKYAKYYEDLKNFDLLNKNTFDEFMRPGPSTDASDRLRDLQKQFAD